MRSSARLFELIQILRGAGRPLTASAIAERLEVSPRTVYRDVAALQARRVPIEGAAGIGYVLRTGYDLPPLAFTPDERDALTVALRLLGHRGDPALQRAARSAAAKLASGPARDRLDALHVSPWVRPPPSGVDLALVRRAIRTEQALALTYEDAAGRRTCRTIEPLALVYCVEVVLVAGWCRLRQEFRHFRADRIWATALSEPGFAGRGHELRTAWRQLENVQPWP